MYDTIIIGAGPAGLAAAVYAARQKINFVIISKDIGGQTLWSSDIENYLGFHLISGIELIQKFKEHIKDYNIDLREGQSIKQIKKKGKNFLIITDKEEYETRTVLITAGKEPKKLEVTGEQEFLGKGVTYCATCDAPIFKGKSVAVIGGGNAALDSASLAAKYSKKVMIINLNKEFKGEKTLIEKINKTKNIETSYNTKIKEIFGNKFVEGIKINQAQEEKTIKVQGVFIEIGSIPSTHFDKLTQKNEKNEIIINEDKKKHMTNMTSVEGIFAAGDVTDTPEKQIAVATGEGVKAIISIFKYLQKN
jgi:NADH-dependent peroxiredoxin subunit F